jgi:hypothetical protein
MEIKDKILEIDNFFEIFIQRELLALVYKNYNLDWRYYDAVTGGPAAEYSNEIMKQFSKSGKVKDVAAFTHKVVGKSEDTYIKILDNIKKNLQSKCNIEVDYFQRGFFIFTPPDPLYDTKNFFAVPHVDFEDTTLKNFLYYVNDNDAETIFFDKIYDPKMNKINNDIPDILCKIKPKQGKAVIFDSNIYHASSVSQLSKRIVLSVVFKPK